jgi:hypothetical protein
MEITWNVCWLMEADPYLPGWGRRPAPPPIAGGKGATIRARMKFVTHHLANQRVGAHVRGASLSLSLSSLSQKNYVRVR